MTMSNVSPTPGVYCVHMWRIFTRIRHLFRKVSHLSALHCLQNHQAWMVPTCPFAPFFPQDSVVAALHFDLLKAAGVGPTSVRQTLDSAENVEAKKKALDELLVNAHQRLHKLVLETQDHVRNLMEVWGIQGVLVIEPKLLPLFPETPTDQDHDQKAQEQEDDDDFDRNL